MVTKGGANDEREMGLGGGSAKKSQNYWAQTLQQIVSSKMLKKVKTKGEAIQVLKVHMQNAENIIRNIIKVQQSNGAKKRIFTMMGEWLN